MKLPSTGLAQKFVWVPFEQSNKLKEDNSFFSLEPRLLPLLMQAISCIFCLLHSWWFYKHIWLPSYYVFYNNLLVHLHIKTNYFINLFHIYVTVRFLFLENFNVWIGYI